MPLVRPVTVHDVAPEVVQLFAPGEDVTVYPVIAEPPSVNGALQERVASVFPGTATTLVGTLGIVRGVMEFEAIDVAELPAAFSATTEKV